MVQVSHPYMTTGKTIALTIWTFASILNAYQIFTSTFGNVNKGEDIQ